ncbi:MAG: Gfo/Idh/MocA family oxidoreductase [Chloroflexota bacterium]|nr:Gfo/Idh/MocA family oxidoreductase [Chloroflexota bacterium]
MAPIRMAQYGTKHGHSPGKVCAILQHPEVELAGVFEPDMERRRQLQEEDSPYQGVHWFGDKREMLKDPTIVAIASEGRNDESLNQTEETVEAGKHVWYDKPAGDNWEQWRRVVALAREKSLIIQMGYMFRYHNGFRQIAEWVKSGLLGDIFGIRAHMSNWIPESGGAFTRSVVAQHTGGMFYDLGGHMLDQITWLQGRPVKATPFFRNDATPSIPEFMDNTLVVFEYERAMVFVDIAAMEIRPPARRFEVYGTAGSAIMEPFEPATKLRLCLERARDGFRQGEQYVPIEAQDRQELYNREVDAFVSAITGERPPDRTLDHELLVQETLLRATGGIPGS